MIKKLPFLFYFLTLYQISLLSHSEKGKKADPKVLDFKNSLRENS